MPLPWERQKSLEELEEIEKRKTVELSIAEKNAMIAKLKKAGLTPKQFGFNYRAIMNWIKTH